MANVNNPNTNNPLADTQAAEIVAQAAGQGSFKKINVAAPYVDVAGRDQVLRKPGDTWKGPTGRGVIFYNEAVIDIEVRELQGAELGALRNTGAKLKEYVDKAVTRKNAEDVAAYGLTTAQLKSKAIESGYFGSQPHIAWSEAAAARSGGKLSAQWWRNFDPTGGTNGNGPNLLPGGRYPHPLSSIGMAHDTDWSLGRHFQAGPMRGLYGANYDAQTLGKYGLDPTSPIKPPSQTNYTVGTSDWKIKYLHRPAQLRSDAGQHDSLADAGERSYYALSDTQNPGHQLFKQALALMPVTVAHHQRENVAGSLVVAASAGGLVSIDAVLESRDGKRLFAVQGDANNPANARVDVDKALAAVSPVEVAAQQMQQWSATATLREEEQKRPPPQIV